MKLPSPDQVLGNKNTLPSPSDVLGTVKKKVASKPLSQEELWGSDSQPQDLYTSLVTGAQEPQQESDGLGGPPKMKTFTGLTPEEQKTLQAKPAIKVSKSVELINKRLKLQNELSKTKVTPENQAEISRKTDELSSIVKEQDKISKTRLSELEQQFKSSKDENSANAEAEERLNNLITNTGVWNNVKSTSIDFYNNVVDELSALTDEVGIKELKADTDPLSEEKNKVVKDALKKKIRLNDKQIEEAAKNLYKEKQVEFIETDRINSFLDNLDDEDKNLLKQDRYNRSVHLQEDNVKQEKIINAYEVVGNKKIKEYQDIENELLKFKSQNKELPKELYDSYINLGFEIKGISNNISKRQKLLQKNKEDLGDVNQEFDFFKRQYGDVENFLLNTGTMARKLAVNTLGGLNYVGSLGGLIGDKNIGVQKDVIRINAEIDDQRDRLRKSVESIESPEGFVNYVSDIMSNQIPSLVATSTGAGGLAAIGVSTAGEKYADMNKEVLEGKAVYSPLQMASVPFLYGAAEVVSEIPTLSILKKGGRLLESISKNEANLITKSVKQKAKEWAKDWSVDTGKEIAGEEFTNFAQNFTNKYILGKKDVGLLDNAGTVLKDTFTLTSILKAAPHVAGAILKPHQTNEDLLILDENSRKIIEFSNQIDSNVLSDKEKAVVTKQMNKLVAKNSEIIANTIDKVDNMPVDVYKKVIELNDKAASIKSEAVTINDGILPNKNDLLKELSIEYKSVKDQRNALVNAEYKNQSPLQEAFNKLDDSKKIKLKDEASRLLIEDAKQRGLKEFEFNDKTITEKAVELFKKEETKPVVEAVEEVSPAVEEIVPAEVAVKPSGQKVTDIINRPATLESQAGIKLETPIEGDVYQEGQRVIFEDKNKKTYDLGNIDEVSDKTVEELGIKPQEEMVSLTPEGKIKVGGNEWNMQSELPNYGIEYDKDGNVKAVSLKDEAGKTVMYEGQVAEDAAYQVLLKQTETPEQRQAINEILENDEELNRQLREAEEATQAAAAEVTEPGAPKTQAEQYSEELDKTKESDPEAYWSVSPVSAADAAKGTIIDTPDGAAIVKPDGDIAGLFKKATSKAKGVAQDLLKRAIAAGGKKLDNFDTYLTPQYIKAGFRVVSRTPFNEEYAPEGWNKEKHGTPDVVAMIYDPDGKLDIEEKTFDDPETGYDDAMAYRDSFLEPSIEAELEGLTKLFDESDKGFRMSQVDNAKEALKGILPGVKFIVHETDEAFNKATGDSRSGGMYIYRPAREGAPASRVIHINKKYANGRTVAHEVFHAVILDKIKGDKKVQEITARMVDAVYKTASPELRAELDAFAARYSDKTIRDEERLAELLGIIADGYPKMSQINKGIVKRWLEALAKMFGRKPFTDNEVIDLLNTLAGKVSTGEVISAEDVAMFKGGKKVDIPSDGLTKRFQYGNDKVKLEIKYLEQDRVEELKEKGLLIEPENLSSLNGKKVVTTSPDDMLVGSIFVNGKEVATGNGGVYFVTKFGDVWANSNKAVANGLAKAINETFDSVTGKSYLALVKGTDAKLVSSPQGVTSSLAVTESMIDAGLFSLSDFRSAVRSAVKSSGGNISLSPNGSAKVLKSEVDNFFKDVTSSTFEKRGNVLRDIVSNLAKSESAKTNKTEIIKFLNGDESKGLGVGKTEKSQSLIDLIATTSAEKLTKGLSTGDVYAIIEIDGKVKVVQDSHQSYPYHIKIVDENGNISNKKPVLILPKNRRNGKEILTSVDGKTAKELGSGFSGKVGATANMPYGKGIIMDDSVSTIKRSQLQEEGVTIEAKNNTLYTVNDNGKTVGSMELTSNKVLGKGYLSVNLSKLNEKYIGKGIGLDLYRTVANKLKDKGIVLTSSVFRNDKSDRVWKSLEKSGEAVKIYSDIRLKDSVYALVNPEVRRSQKVEWEESRIGKGDKAITDRQPVLQNAAERYANKEISYEEYLKIKDVTSPIKPITDFIEPAKEEDIRFAVGINAEGKTNLKFDKGTLLGLRLDINAYINKNIWAITIHAPGKGKVLSYNNVARLKNVTFGSNAKDALNIARHKINKATIARMHGEWIPIDGNTSEEKGKSAMKFVESIVNNPEWSQVGMNPFRHSWFYDRADGKPVLAADELIQIGGLVYAKNVVKTTPYDKAFEFIDQEGDLMRFQEAKGIDEIVRIAKEAKYSDAAITAFLKAKGFSDAQIANAMSKPTITEDEAYDKFNAEFKKSREEITNKKTVKEYIKQKYQNIIKNWSNRQVEAQSLLSKTGMVNTLNLSINSHGYSGKAKRLFQKSYDKIYKGLSTEKRNTLDKVIQAKRFIAIDNNRADRGLAPVKHPNYINKQESQMYLDKLKQEIGDKAFNDITARADEYFSTYKKLLKDVYENGLISKESYESMSDVDYQPRVFLQFVTDFEGDLKTAKNSVDSTSLSSDQIKSMKEGDVNSLVTNSEWLLSNSLVARTNAMAKNNINRRFMTDEFPKAKERFDKLDPKNLKGDDVRFYKYFKELQSKVIDNPIIGYTKEGKPKYKYDDLDNPTNFTKAYYYVDGVQHQFFLEDGLHKSWNDNVDGFLSRDAKELISYASGSALVKAIATGNNPAFPIVNTPRDLMFTAAFSEEYSNFIPASLVQISADVIKSIREIGKKESDLLNKYYEYGGAMDFLSSQGRLKKDSLLGSFTDKMIPANVRDNTKGFFNAITLKKISEYSELMFRLGIFQRSINNSLKELGIKSMSDITDKQQADDIYNSAVASARGILDFNKGGVAAKDLESIIPYINVAFQGGSVALNAFKKNPVATTSRIFQIATIASTIPAGLSLFLIAASKGDDDEDKTAHEIYLDAMAGVSKYQKSKYMNIVTGAKNEDGQYRVIKIAKAQELSPVISVTDDITENMIRQVAGKEPKSNETIVKNAMFSLKNNVLPFDVTSPSGTIVRNPLVKAILTYQTGYDFFRDQPLAMGLEAKPAPYEGLDMKSVEGFYKDLGPKYGLSPVRSKAFVESLITTPDTNPFVGIMYAGAEAMSSNKDAKNVGENLAKNIYKSTGKRIVSYTSDFNRNLEAKQKLEKQIDEIKLKDAILKSEIKLASDRFIAKDITKEQLMDEFKDLDPFDKKRALMKIRDKKMMKDVESNIIDIKYEKSAKVKALMIQNYYGNILDKSDDSKEVIIQMKKAGNILTPEVIYELKNAQ